MRYFLQLTTLLLSTLIAATTAQAATPMEAILAAALLEQKNGRLPWTFYAQNNSPIEWNASETGVHEKTGKAILSVDGFVPQMKDPGKAGGVWKIRASGDGNGVRKLSLVTDTCARGASVSRNCFYRTLPFHHRIGAEPLKHSGLDIDIKRICTFGPEKSKSHIYRLKAAGKAPIYVHALGMHGDDGQDQIYVNVLLSNGHAPLAVDEEADGSAICGLAFQAFWGSASPAAKSYGGLIGSLEASGAD